MAQSNPIGISYQPLIQSNCQAFLGNDVDIDIVSEQDQDGTWVLHVLKTEGGERSAVLSEAGSTLDAAFEQLHRKSAQAIHQYRLSNGFALPPAVTSRSSRQGGERMGPSVRSRRSHKAPSAEDIEQSEIISMGSDSSSCESDASDSDDASCTRASPVGRRYRVVRAGAPSTTTAAYMAVSRGEQLDGAPAHRPRVEMPRMTPLPAAPAAHHPVGPRGSRFSPPPPPPPPPPPSGPPPPPRRAGAITTPEWAVQPPSTPDKPQPTQQACHSMILCVRLAGVGELNVLESLPLSAKAIRERALHIARTRKGEFRPGGAGAASTVALSDLCASIERLRIGDVTLKTARFGDDLSGLYAGGPHRMCFDIRVWNLPRAPPPARECEGVVV